MSSSSAPPRAFAWRRTSSPRSAFTRRLRAGGSGDHASGAAFSPTRRGVVHAGAWAGLFPFGGDRGRASAKGPDRRGGGPGSGSSMGPTNEVVEVVNGSRRKRMGGGDVVVSELGLGTQRWGGADFNSPDEALCHEMLDLAVLEHGVNLVDTAEQYPIPSDRARPEGRTETIIGNWLAKDPSRREKLVVATKITGGANVTRKNIKKDLEGSLLRLRTDYVDVYTLHWPARYTPQSNWGQSLMYHVDTEAAPYYKNAASFEEIAEAMGDLIAEGKLRGWGSCNDNAYGLTAACYAARSVGAPPPIAIQGDFSLINRRAEENGVSEAASPVHENFGLMAYNALAGGVLTGKYVDVPAAVDNARDRALAERLLENPRGRMDDYSWGKTLYRYRSAPALDATERYAKLADRFGMSLAEMALRWCGERDAVTTTLVGHTSVEQLRQSLEAFRADREPMPRELMWEIDRVHMRNRLPIFASERVGKDWEGTGEIGERVP